MTIHPITTKKLLPIWFCISIVFSIAQPSMAQTTQDPIIETIQDAHKNYNQGKWQEVLDRMYPVWSNTMHASFHRQEAMHLWVQAYLSLFPKQYLKPLNRFSTMFPSSEYVAPLWIKYAQQQKQMKNYDTALRYYYNALSHPMPLTTKEKCWYWMAQIEGLQKNLAKKHTWLEKIYLHGSTSHIQGNALYEDAVLWLEEDSINVGMDKLNHFLRIYPNHNKVPEIQLLLAQLYIDQQEYDHVFELLKDNIAIQPNTTARIKALQYINATFPTDSDWHKRRSYYLQLLNNPLLNDIEPHIQFNLGWTYFQLEAYHLAIESFVKSVSDPFPSYGCQALYYKAISEKFRNQLEYAILSFRNYGQQCLSTADEQAYYEWAITAMQLALYNEAVDVLLTYIRQYDTLEREGELYYLLAESFFANGEYTSAIQAYDKAAQFIDVDTEIKYKATFHKGWLLYQNQLYADALPYFERTWQKSMSDSLKSEALFWLADCAFHIKNYDAAATWYDTFVKNYPQHQYTSTAWYGKGWSLFKSQNYNQAIDAFNFFLKNYNPPPKALFSYDVDAQLRIGDAFFAEKNYRKAAQYYNQVAEKNTVGADYALFRLAQSYHRRQMVYDAVQQFRKLLKRYPKSKFRPNAQFAIAMVYMNVGNYSKAIHEFEVAIKLFPQTAWAARSQYHIGDAHYNSQNYDDALKAYKTLLYYYPRSSYVLDAIQGMEYIQQAQNKTVTGYELLEKFLIDFPSKDTKDQLRLNYIELLINSEDDNTKPLLNNFLKTKHSNKYMSQAHFLLSKIYQKENDIQTAINHLETAHKLVSNESDYDKILYALGTLYYRINSSVAKSYFSDLIYDRSQYRLMALYYLGNIAYQNKNYTKATEIYKKALALNNNHIPTRLGLAKCALMMKQWHTAEDILRSITAMDSSDETAQAQYLLALMWKDLGRYETAITEYQRLQALYANHKKWLGLSLVDIIDCYLALQKRQEAQELYKIILRDYKDTQLLQKAQNLFKTS